MNIGEMLGKALGDRTKTRRVTVKDSHDILVNEESDKLLDTEEVVPEAVASVENDGIVFLDEIDKIAPARAATAPTSPARACSAISCRSSRGPPSRPSTAR